ncbi:pentapeptide repeat-containing protein [Demequina sp. SYSU T00192]|uniref:Pentapeptide repeat-containing protein n=1 Tax=Demequina litoralis TaxID=3051660 RepID=A0ABT8G6A1_9MICO|nr:pentapeptide repeat-containing protein [Demequina sp. SYSU T00192]MDN4474673.1 pentapeptide repeat-containing protein [Demequina sp. SYSU T00192]
MAPTPTGFFTRHRDELILQAIGSLVLGMFVSLALYVVDQMREDARNARDESLGNSLFVRQAVMSDRDVLPFSALYLAEAQLSGLDLAGADLSDAVLAGAELKGTDLAGADLSEADLSGADLSGADLSGASLAEADLSGADLSGTVLTGADLTAVEADGAGHDPGDPPIGAEALGEDLRVDAGEDADDD